MVESLLVYGAFQAALDEFNASTMAFKEALETIEAEGDRLTKYWRHAWCAGRCHEKLAQQWLLLRSHEPHSERSRMISYHLDNASSFCKTVVSLADQAGRHEMEVEKARYDACNSLVEVACIRAEWLLSENKPEEAAQSAFGAVKLLLEPLPSFHQMNFGPLVGGISLILIRAVLAKPELAITSFGFAAVLLGMAKKEREQLGDTPSNLTSLAFALRLDALTARTSWETEPSAEHCNDLEEVLDALEQATSPVHAETIRQLLAMDGPKS